MKKSSIRLRLVFGAALVLLGFLLTSKGAYEVNTASFENEPVKFEGLDGYSSEETDVPEKIVIPGLGINLPVEKAEIVNGYWEVFDDRAGWGVGSGYPGNDGNQVIFAHARDGQFLPLQDVRQGMQIYVFTDSNWFSYEVKEIKEVWPSNTEVVDPTEDETLTLYTCSGYQDEKRLIVTAKRS